MSSILLKAVLAGSLITMSLGGEAIAQPARFDPSLSIGQSPMVTDVQFRGNGGIRRLPGGGGGRFRGGPGGFQGRGQRFGGGGFNGGGYRHRGGRGIGLGIGAGVAGLAAGALIGGAIASQANPGYGYDGYGGGYGGYDQGYAPAPVDGGYAVAGDDTGYCAQRFKSYDPSSGTYLGFDGQRHPCP